MRVPGGSFIDTNTQETYTLTRGTHSCANRAFASRTLARPEQPSASPKSRDTPRGQSIWLHPERLGAYPERLAMVSSTCMVSTMSRQVSGREAGLAWGDRRKLALMSRWAHAVLLRPQHMTSLALLLAESLVGLRHGKLERCQHAPCCASSPLTPAYDASSSPQCGLRELERMECLASRLDVRRMGRHRESRWRGDTY